MVPTDVTRSDGGWFAAWVRGHIVTTIILATTFSAILIVGFAAGIVSSRTEAFHASRDAAAAAAKANRAAVQAKHAATAAHRLSVGLCRDVNQRVGQRRQSDAASSRGWAGIALQLRLALAAVPPAQRTAHNLRGTWRIWAAAHHAALQLRDKGITTTVTQC